MHSFRSLIYLAVFAVLLMAFACSSGGDSLDDDVPSAGLIVTSSAFSEGESIPDKYTCNGDDVSPPLQWAGIPKDTASVAVIVDDPDSPRGTWIHWVAWGLSPDSTGLDEGQPAVEHLPNSGDQGENDFKLFGYNGPCPPRGDPHRYFFRVYALDTDDIGLYTGATAWDLRREMGAHVLASGHVLAIGTLMGTYQSN